MSVLESSGSDLPSDPNPSSLSDEITTTAIEAVDEAALGFEADEDQYNNTTGMIAKPSSLNWLSEELIETIESHRPRESISSTNPVDESEMIAAFESFFDEIPQFENMYQLHQAINYLGDFYGFTTRYSGYKIICACGKNHQQKKSEPGQTLMELFVPTGSDHSMSRILVGRQDPNQIVDCVENQNTG